MDDFHVFVGTWALDCFHSHISTQTFRRSLTASVDNCAEIKSAPSMAYANLAESGGRCRKAVLGVCLVLRPRAPGQVTSRTGEESDLRPIDSGLCRRRRRWQRVKYKVASNGAWQTPSTGLRHPSFLGRQGKVGREGGRVDTALAQR